jgi:hypothetical protein
VLRETSPMTTTIRIPPCSKRGTILQTFFREEWWWNHNFWTKYELVMIF